MTEESFFIEINSKTAKENLHLKRFYENKNGEPVLMIHGSIENGKIFYSSSGKGLAPYLANKGFDVFVVDLRGRGQSTPAINKHSKHGLSEILRDDFDAYLAKIKELKGDVPQHWIAHSWGGIMILAYLAKNLHNVKISSMIFFATKRRLTVWTLKKMWRIDFMWGFMARLGIALKGYIPAKEVNAGSDNETKKSFLEAGVWVKSKRWLDWYDQFDYALALKKLKLPPTLYLTGKNDNIICHPKDVRLLMEETGDQNNSLKILGRANGYKQDYGHIDILTHVDAPDDVYPLVIDFMKQ